MESRGPLPPVLLLGAIIAMVALHFLWPVASWIPGPWRWLGVVLVVLGLGLNVYASRLFERRGTAIRPFDRSSVLVEDGPFRMSRNPMYLGMMLILGGVALGLGTVTPWIAVPMFMALIQQRFIRSEEKKMEAEFGAAYVAYRRKVRRWL